MPFGSFDATGVAQGACTGMVPAQLWTLTNTNGLMAKLTDFGATLVELHVPDRMGVMADIVQGFDMAAGYADSQFAGATVGRVGNRINQGVFSVDGIMYQVTGAGPADADPPNHSLHGGPCGWDKQLWAAKAQVNGDGDAEIAFTLTSPDMDMGFPGMITATTTYTLTNADELRIVMSATTTAASPINMLHHSYFNLQGDGTGSILAHELQLFAANYTPAGAAGVPDGTQMAVAGTPYDFMVAHPIGQALMAPGVESEPGIPGYDHNWVVDGDPSALRPVARVKDPATGRVMTIDANQPGVQFYTTNYRPDPADAMATPTIGKLGRSYQRHGAFALETQKHPNAINFPAGMEPGAEDEIIRPGMETYTHTMVHRFTTE